MARDRRPSRASPKKHVEFDENLISGPSRRSAIESSSAADVDTEMTDLHPAEQQLQEDFTQSAATDYEDDGSEASDDSSADAMEYRARLRSGQDIMLFDELTNAQKDYRVCKGLGFLIDEIEMYAEAFATFDTKGSTFMRSGLTEENRQLIRYIGCIAQGGRNGIHGWSTLLTDTTCRQALVMGIVGRALEEHVFSSLFFGGDKALIERLHEMEMEQVDDEGFSRTQSRASAILASKPSSTATKVAKFHEQVAKIAAELSSMLGPLGRSTKPLDLDLYSIVSHAGLLNQMMRLASDVVYYWPPTFKDEEFEPGRMEALNLTDMIENSPYDRKEVNGRDRAILKPDRKEESEAIVRVVCFPGLVAYRQFGGDLAKKEIAAEKRRGVHEPEDVQAHRRRIGEQPLTVTQGIRSRTIRKSLVLLQWGQQRLLTKEAGTSSHIDAVRDGKMSKYDDDYRGFVELYSFAEKKWNKR